MRRKPPPKPKEVETDTTALFLPTCPACGAPIQTQATVEKFGAPQGWTFYGLPGERWKKCKGQSGPNEFIHFVVAVNGRPHHRLAWIKAAALPNATQPELLP
jgi:hypothetical protein